MQQARAVTGPPKSLGERIRDWKQSRFAKNFVGLLSANVAAQFLPLLAAPVMTRLYAPADYGLIALLTAAVAILTAFATFRLDWFLASSKGIRRARVFLLCGGVLVLAVSLLLLACAPLVRQAVLARFGAAFGPLLWVVPFAVLLSGSYQMLVGWCVRSAEMIPVARGRIVAAVLSTMTGIGLGLLGYGWTGLLLMTLISWAVPLLMIAVSSWRSLSAGPYGLALQSAGRVLGQSRQRITYSGLTGIVNAAGLFLPMIVISAQYSPVEAGWYALMQRVATVPLSTISTAVGHSFWAEANQLHKTAPAQLGQLFNKTLRVLALVGLACGVACLLGPLYVGPLFGAKSWSGAGWVLASLAPYFATQLVVSPLASIVTVLGHERWLFYWDIARTVLILVALLLCHALHTGFVPAVAAFALVMAGAYLVLLGKMRRLLADLIALATG